MQEVAPTQRLFHRFSEIDRNLHLEQALESLESENLHLKKLVVRLSETIIRNVTTKAWPKRKRSAVQP